MYLLCFKTRKLVISLRFFLLEQTLASLAISSGTAHRVGLGGFSPPTFLAVDVRTLNVQLEIFKVLMKASLLLIVL